MGFEWKKYATPVVKGGQVAETFLRKIDSYWNGPEREQQNAQQRGENLLEQLRWQGVDVQDLMRQTGVSSFTDLVELNRTDWRSVDQAIIQLQQDTNRNLQYATNPDEVGDKIADVQRRLFEGKREDFLEELRKSEEDAERQFGRKRRGIEESFSDRIGALNAKIADARADLSNVNSATAEFLDRITPGFKDAIAQARAAAAATAAIEQTFAETEEGVDSAYASASGRVRAIAHKVGGAGSSVMAGALEEGLYEMKTFIDQQVELDRTQTVALHKIGGELAAAAAESEFAGAKGEAKRTQYVEQKKYEKIIQNLVRQRQAANIAKQRALRDLLEQQEDWRRAYDEGREEGLEALAGDQAASVFAANADLDNWLTATGRTYFDNLVGTGLEVEASDEAAVSTIADAMAQAGLTDMAQYLLTIPEDSEMATQIGRHGQYEDAIEVLAATLIESEQHWNQEIMGDPRTTMGSMMQDFSDLLDMNVDQRTALDLISQRDDWKQFVQDAIGG